MRKKKSQKWKKKQTLHRRQATGGTRIYNRTYFHIGQSYGMSESNCFKIIRWVEDTLIKYPDFALPGKKELLKSDVEYEVLVIDGTETPVERPKKSKSPSTLERKKDIL